MRRLLIIVHPWCGRWCHRLQFGGIWCGHWCHWHQYEGVFFLLLMTEAASVTGATWRKLLGLLLLLCLPNGCEAILGGKGPHLQASEHR